MYRVTTLSRAPRASRLAVAVLALATLGAAGDQAEARSRHHKLKAAQKSAETATTPTTTGAQGDLFATLFTPAPASGKADGVEIDNTETASTTRSNGRSTKARATAPGTGVASFYGGRHHGGPTASGERFNQYAMTAAHRSAPLGSQMRVTNLNNGKSVVVRINDRGPFVRGRIIDVSKGAAQALGFVSAGLTKVKVEPMS